MQYAGLVRSYIFIWTSVNLWPVPTPETRPLAKHAHEYKIHLNLCDHIINMVTCCYFTINHLNTSSKRTRVGRFCPFGVILFYFSWNLVVGSLLNFAAGDIPGYLQAFADELLWLGEGNVTEVTCKWQRNLRTISGRQVCHRTILHMITGHSGPNKHLYTINRSHTKMFPNYEESEGAAENLIYIAYTCVVTW